jgi:hypothetical protein
MRRLRHALLRRQEDALEPAPRHGPLPALLRDSRQGHGARPMMPDGFCEHEVPSHGCLRCNTPGFACVDVSRVDNRLEQCFLPAVWMKLGSFPVCRAHLFTINVEAGAEPDDVFLDSIDDMRDAGLIFPGSDIYWPGGEWMTCIIKATLWADHVDRPHLEPYLN